MYKKKILFSLFMGAFTVFPIVAPVYATNISDENPAFGQLTAQIQNVQEYGAHRPIKLVLGASTDEVNYGKPENPMPNGIPLNERFDESYIFLSTDHDNEPNNPFNHRALTLDFNDLDALRYMSGRLSNFFDQIIFDDSTFKFTKWNTDHLREMKNLLKPGGEFIFAPITDQFSITEKKFKEHNDVYQDVENQIKSSSDQFITEYEMPKIVPHSYLLMDTVEKMEDIYKRFKLIGTPETRPAIAKQMNLEWSSSLEGNDDKFLRLFINQIVNRSDIQYNILINYLVPLNYRPLCESVFGVQNIKIDYDVPLPFDSNYKKIQSVLFTLTKEAGTGGSVSSWQ